MINQDHIYKRLPDLKAANQFIIYSHSWWDGCGFDAVALWNDGTKFRKQVLETGETTTFAYAKVVVEKTITEKEFRQLLDKIEKTKGFDVTPQIEKVWLTHYDIVCGIKPNPQSEPQWLLVPGGKHLDPKADSLIKMLNEYCPEFP